MMSKSKSKNYFSDDPVINALFLDTYNRGLYVDETESPIKTSIRSNHLAREASKRLVSPMFPSITNIFNVRNAQHRHIVPKINDNNHESVNINENSGYDEHLLSLKALAEQYETSINENDISKSEGLTNAKAEGLLHELGRNILSPPPRISFWLLFVFQITNLFMILLLFAGFLSLIAYTIPPSDPVDIQLGCLLIIVVLATCLETCRQENKSNSLMKKFLHLVPEAVTVIREGVLFSINTEELVIGDIIKLKYGERIPADCRLISVTDTQVDQSMLTGENEIIHCSVEPKTEDALQATNIIFKGAIVISGSCYAVVIRTGDDTLVGTVTNIHLSTTKDETTLRVEVDDLVRKISKVSIFLALLIFIVGVSRGLPVVRTFIRGFVVMIIANIPQGLPSAVTTSLLIVAERMQAQNVFVKKLDVVETLGSCSLICTDKTGTLTKNAMSVSNIWMVRGQLTPEELLEENRNETAAILGGDMLPLSSAIHSLMKAAILNSSVALIKQKYRNMIDQPPVPCGDSLELGIYRLFSELVDHRTRIQVEEYRTLNAKVFEIPFSPAHKWQASVHMLPESRGREVLFLKGAPEVIVTKCSHYLNKHGVMVPMDNFFEILFREASEKLVKSGEHLLAFAYKNLNRTIWEEESVDPKFKEKLKDRLVGKWVRPAKDLCFIGLISLLDTPRPEVAQAIADCRSAGIKVVMVTGDHPLTAFALAKQVGIITLPTRSELAKQSGVLEQEVLDDDVEAVVIHGSDMDNFTDIEWKRLVLKKEIVFARISPEQKSIIVRQFKDAGHVVAMTGNGVNDAPALREAAIGVAMGLEGSEMAREAADMVLLDDNFASIVVGIKEGRLLFSNLKKSIAYTLTHLTPMMIPMFLWACIGLPRPLSAMLTMCIDLLTEFVPSISLVYEKPESDIMTFPPRNIKVDRLVSIPLLCYSYLQAGVIETGVCLVVYFWTFSNFGISASELFQNNNKYFTVTPAGVYTTSTGVQISKDEQKQILAIVQASWFMMLVCCQAIHIWVCRTSTISLLQHGLFSNMITNIGVLLAIGIACLVVYLPDLQSLLKTGPPASGVDNSFNNPYPSLQILVGSLVCGLLLWGWSEIRKYLIRNYSQSRLGSWLKW